MKKRIFGFGLYSLIFIVLCGGCKSEFEKTRLSNDPKVILAKSIEFYEAEEYLRAQTLFELILNQYRGTKEAEQLFFYYAYSHYYLRSYQLASHYFKNFANTFAYSPYREEADFMAAYSNYRLSPGFRLDQKPTVAAIEGFQEFVNRYPTSDRVAQCNDLIDEMRKKLEDKAFSQGELYVDIREYEAAITSFETMLRNFPETDRAAEIRFLMVKASYLYAQNSIFDKRAERYEKSSEHYKDFIAKHGKTAYAKEARAMEKEIKKQLKTLKNERYKIESSGN